MARAALLPITGCFIAGMLVVAGHGRVAAGQGGGTGTIEGRVRLTATPPANPPIRMGADPNCLKINVGKRVFQETVLRDAEGGLANVFVHVRGPFPQTSPPAEPVTIEQRGCTYHPRVLGARVGQTLQIVNSDNTLHNIHSMTTTNNAFNVGQPLAGMVYKFALKSEEVMLHVRCDVHSWMTGYLGVVSHPYHAVTGEKGPFRLANVPAGRHTVQAWHEQYGPLTQIVDVKVGATATVEFTYSGTEKRPGAGDGLIVQELTVPAGATVVQLLPPQRLQR